MFYRGRLLEGGVPGVLAVSSQLSARRRESICRTSSFLFVSRAEILRFFMPIFSECLVVSYCAKLQITVAIS